MNTRLLLNAAIALLLVVGAFSYVTLRGPNPLAIPAEPPTPINPALLPPIAPAVIPPTPEASSTPLAISVIHSAGQNILSIPALDLTLTVPSSWWYQGQDGYFATAPTVPDGLGASDLVIAISSGSFDGSTAVDGTAATFAKFETVTDGGQIPDANLYGPMEPYIKIKNLLVNGYPGVYVHKDAPPDSDGQAMDLVWVSAGATSYYIEIDSPEEAEAEYAHILASIRFVPQ
jgi:hypothetical protein